MTAQGDCFIVAARLATSEPGLTLVHGLVYHDDLGEHWHAWVERVEVIEHPGLAGPLRLEHVIDRSNGRDNTVPVALYYKLGRIERTWRYSSEEAETLMSVTGHFGPWEDDPTPELPAVRRCPSCGGRAPWSDDAWTCERCGDEWYPDHFNDEDTDA
jgi:hypothetical protein